MSRVQTNPNFYSQFAKLMAKVTALGRAVNQITAVGGVLSGTLPNPSMAPLTWHGLTYETGAGTGNWSDYNVSQPGQYALDAQGFCHLRGTVKNGTTVGYPSTNIAIATGLPVPAVNTNPTEMLLYTDSTGNHGCAALQVNSTGVLTLAGFDWSNNGGNSGLYTYAFLCLTPYAT